MRGSLAYALLGAAELVAGVAQGESLATRQPRLAQAWALASNDRGAIQALSFHTLRGWGRARALRRALVPKPPKPALLQALLDVALAHTAPAERPSYAPHTLADQAVRAARAHPALRHAAGLVNAVLRRYFREPPAWAAQVLQGDEAQWNHPPWWVARLRAAYPDAWQAVLAAGDRPAPMCLRVNRRRITPAAYVQQLVAAGHSAHVCGELGVIVEQPVPVERLPGFAQGDVSVQDWGAQWAAELLGARDGERVLDACAAPGGKAAHVLERADVQLLALDQDAGRLARVHDTLQRLGLQARLVVGDAGAPAQWWDGRAFDRILLDAPCSASGVERRHPDIRWLRRDADIDALAAQQRRLLDAVWPLLRKPGGRLVYCTCSVFPQEGALQTTAFLARTPDAVRVPLNLGHNVQSGSHDGQFLPVGTAALPHDGFYYAIFERT
ncbi:MAG: 16S rRNA (cytosine(967)-C(5))-methyltransferase RsmB [Betaproteobacteria bacterium]|nr:16S rRNA (cytosine(967)-C(5))-methyltransferase RsmB [Betaproteobacteria bacterium]